MSGSASNIILSIVCPTFNCVSTVRSLIDSVLLQSCDSYELIILDGGSTDGTVEIIREYGNRINYISEPDNGIYDAMNKGIDMAKGEWLYFIGADDSLYSNNVVEKVIPQLGEDVDVLMCDIMSPKLGRCSSVYSLKTFFTNTIHHQGVIYRRKVFESHRYDTTLKIMADYEMNLYVWRSVYRIKSSDIIFANHTPEGVSGQPHLINYNEEIAVRNKYMKNKPLQWFFTMVSYSKFIIKNLKR